MKLFIQPGDILLTAGVGGPAAKWRDRFLSRAILAHQNIQQIGFKATRSHAELIYNDCGGTFSARWRTRYRPNGLADYIGSDITIGRPVNMSPARFCMMMQDSGIQDWDGNIYPVHRILMQAAGTFAFRWLVKLGFLKTGMCSELVGKFLNAGGYSCCKHGWRGITPADLERDVRYGDDFSILYDGPLTEGIVKDSMFTVFPKEEK